MAEIPPSGAVAPDISLLRSLMNLQLEPAQGLSGPAQGSFGVPSLNLPQYVQPERSSLTQPQYVQTERSSLTQPGQIRPLSSEMVTLQPIRRLRRPPQVEGITAFTPERLTENPPTEEVLREHQELPEMDVIGILEGRVSLNEPTKAVESPPPVIKPSVIETSVVKPPVEKKTELFQFDLELMEIRDASRELEYRERKDEQKTSLKWGQRKLLISEIQVLNYVDLQKAQVVYAGAAPGTHIPFLWSLFPQMSFHLYDPATFRIPDDPRYRDQISVYQKLFTNEDAAYWADQSQRYGNVIFISDIRESIEKVDQSLPIEEQQRLHLAIDAVIHRNMTLQMEWHRVIRPYLTSLKFRLPFYEPYKPSRFYRYLNGTILKQVWEGQTSTECRLIIQKGEVTFRDYDIKKFQDQMFYHNAYVRESVRFNNIFTGNDEPIDPPELLQDYDSVAEAVILYTYLNQHGYDSDVESVKKLSRNVTQSIKGEGTLAYRRIHVPSSTKAYEERLARKAREGDPVRSRGRGRGRGRGRK